MLNFHKLSAALCIGIAFSSAILIGQCFRAFPNVDEVAHLPAGVSHLAFGRFDLYRVNPPLVRSVAAIASIPSDVYDWKLYSTQIGVRPEFTIGKAALSEHRTGLVSFYAWPRLLSLVFWMAGIVVLARVGMCIGGQSRVIACLLWGGSPAILANSASVCPDLGSISVGMLASLAGWRYFCNPKAESAIIAGLCVGFALLTKLTWITGLATIPLTAGLGFALFRQTHLRRSMTACLCDLAAFLVVALSVLNLGYFFEGSFIPLGDFKFCSEMLGGVDCNASNHGNRFSGSWLAKVPVPVPANYLLGIDYLKYEVENKMWSFLSGEWKYGSWSHYYVMTTLFKTPESTLIGAMIGLGVLIIGVRRKMVKPEVIAMFLFLIIPAAVSFAAVSLQGGFNHHHRYVLMIYPPMFALAAYIASPVGVRLLRFRLPFLGKSKHSIAVPLAFTLVALSAASSLRVHPYYTSYFNTISGGPANGWRLLGFSNIDWGQDILEVDKWLKENTEKRPLVMDLDYFDINGELFEIPTSLPPQLPENASIDEVRRSVSETQWWIISVKKLYNLPGHDGLEYLQQIEPIDRIAYAYHVYRIDPLRSSEPPTSP